uniref:Uncharacterized protein n=1 Tax=Tanacetum cinerariifolium TaxID=118510 RepID=A0A699VWD2_TANCI|nr:hypothetical protein [Tanacetum cinerariifolium]
MGRRGGGVGEREGHKANKKKQDKPDVGACLYVFLADGTHYDYLQNSVLDCQEFALEEFGIPLNCWQEASSVSA